MNRWINKVLEDQRGVSLPELLITVFLMSVISALVMGLVVTFTGTFNRERATNHATTTAAAAMKELTRVVRSGTELRVSGEGMAHEPVFITAEPDEVEIYAFIDTSATAPQPVRVRFAVDDEQRLVQTRWAATATESPWSFASEPSLSRAVVHHVAEDRGPVFEYLDVGNRPLEIPEGGFSKEQRRTIAAVRITLTIDSDETGRTNPVTIQNAVGLPNRGISRVRS